MSSGGGQPGAVWREYHTRRKIDSCTLRKSFLRDCFEEKVLPKETPKQLRKVPFSECAALYLSEACEDLQNTIDKLQGDRSRIPLPSSLMRRLESERVWQSERLQRKLVCLCENSDWKNLGRTDLIVNLSDKQLSSNEKEALALGLKFDVGVDRKGYTEYVEKNYKWSDTDVEKGFKQGVLACYQAMAQDNKYNIPKRYRKALENLGSDESIVISSADKGGGVVIMNRDDYINKMGNLLSDNSTYEKKQQGYANLESEKFKKEVRKILMKTERGKKMVGLLEEAPIPPRMYGLPKIHKPNIPMRPITSGISSAPHRLAKCLAKPLSSRLGTISGAHLRNSTDLITKLKNVNFENKVMVSFDVKALFTNVPVDGAIEAVRTAIDDIDERELPIAKNDYLRLVSLCVRFGPFVFNGEEYRQHRGLAMGSPLSAVMACLYMEIMERDKYMAIMGRGSSWFRYVDDVIAVIPRATNVDNKLRRLNAVNRDIQFTVEREEDNKLPFLDTLIWRQSNNVKFSVYRKATNKNDLIHYYSGHCDKVKSGVVIGFFLRAFRVCSDEHLANEITYIKKVFSDLKYPEGLLCRLERKAKGIRERKKTENKYISVPNSKNTTVIDRFLGKAGVLIARTTGTKIGDIVKGRRAETSYKNENSVVYKIPCSGCSKAYYGETSRGMAKRVYEHKGDVRAHRTSNSLVVHIDECGHLPKWEATEALHKCLDKKKRKIVEAAYICIKENINSRDGFITLAGAAGLAIAGEARRLEIRAASDQSDDERGRRRPKR